VLFRAIWRKSHHGHRKQQKCGKVVARTTPRHDLATIGAEAKLIAVPGFSSRSFPMSKIVRGALAAVLLSALAACATAPAADAPPGPTRKLDAKTQLECGKRC
jgi:hypothetical protein